MVAFHIIHLSCECIVISLAASILQGAYDSSQEYKQRVAADIRKGADTAQRKMRQR